MNLLGALECFSFTSSSAVDAVGCALAQAVRDLNSNLEEDDFFRLFESSDRGPLTESVLEMVLVRWMAELYISGFDVKLCNCPHWFSEEHRAREFLLSSSGWLDFLDPDS